MWNLIQNMNKVIDSIPGPLEEESHTGRVSTKDGDQRLRSLVRNEAAMQKRSHSHLKQTSESLTKI